MNINYKNLEIGNEIICAHNHIMKVIGKEKNIIKLRGEFYSSSIAKEKNGEYILIKPRWNKKLYSDRIFFVSNQPNNGACYVLNTEVTLSYNKKLVKWTPRVFIGNQELKPKNKTPIIVDDSINNHYKNNVLMWDYGVIKRYLRVIESSILEYFVLEKNPNDDVIIKSEAVGDDLFNRRYVVDKNGIPIDFSYEKNSKIVKKEELSRKDIEYPITIDDSATFYSTSSDGHLTGNAFTYTASHDKTTGSVADTSSTLSVGQRSIGYRIFRGALFFDTSSLNENATINSASFSFVVDSDNSDTDFDIVIQKGTSSTYPHDPLEEDDYYYANYTGNLGSINTSSITVGSYNNISINDLTIINAGGTTKFVIRSSRDINSSEPSNDEYVSIRSNEYGTGSQPRLIIDYTLALPDVETHNPESIGKTFVKFVGEVTDTNSLSIDKRGFQWGTSSGNYDYEWYETGSFGLGAFSHNVTDLSPNTIYYFRAFVHSENGYAYGSELSFKTLDVDGVILSPTANGDEITIDNQYPSSGDHYDKVDDIWNNPDIGTFIQHTSTSTWGRDLYVIQDPIVNTGSIDSITIYLRTFLGDGADYDYAKPSLKTNGSVVDGNLISSKEGIWAYHSQTWTTNPVTGSNWTWSDINNLQIGVSLKRGTGSINTRCSQVYVKVLYSEVSEEEEANNKGDIALNTKDSQLNDIYISSLTYSDDESAGEIRFKTIDMNGT